MKVLSLFDGMSCGQIALEKVGAKVDTYYASEIQPQSIQITQKNYPNTVQLGDITKLSTQDLDELGEIDLLIGGSPCFVAGTLITTKEGYKNIEDIEIGDEVLTHTNSFKKVVEPMVNQAEGIYNIRIQGSPINTVTGEHPYYVREMYRTYKKEEGKRKNRRNWTEPKWVKAKDLDPKKHFVGFAENQLEENPYGITETEAWLIGRYVADGYLRTGKRSGKGREGQYNNQVIFCIGKHKLNDFKEQAGEEYYIGYAEDRTVFKGRLINKRMTELCLKAGRGSENKVVPDFILNLPKELLEMFLNGYLSGDGYENSKEIRAVSISQKLIFGLGQVVQKVYNTPYSIYYHEPAKTKVIEGRTVNQKPQWSIAFSKARKKQNKAVYIEGMLWKPIKKVEYDKDFCGEVYNFEVEEDNSYVANNVTVHNCQNLSRTVINDIKHNQGLKGAKSSLFYEYLRVLEYVKPKYFLLENVESMKSEDKDIITEALGVEPVMINSGLVSAQDRKRYYWTNIPNVTQPIDKGLVLSDIVLSKVPDKYWYKHSVTFHGDDKRPVATLDMNVNYDMLKRVYGLHQKSPTLTGVRGGHHQKKVLQYGKARKLTPTEYELLQTVPLGYTEGVADSHRYNMLGDGWTVDVIAHIFKGLKNI